MTVAVPDEHIGAVLGKGGRTISEIQVASGVRIKVSDRGDFIPGTRNRSVTLFGTEQGLCGQLFLDGERVARGWVIDTHASRRAGAGGVSAIHAECDLTGDGRADVVIGRDDGSIETYAFDENGEPALAGRVDCGEAVQTLRHGRVTTPFPEILAHTFSGKVISFKPGADSTSADGFGMGEALDDAQAAARRFAEKRRVDDVRLETERLAAETQVARAKYAELSGDLIAADGPSRVLDRFLLGSEEKTGGDGGSSSRPSAPSPPPSPALSAAATALWAVEAAGAFGVQGRQTGRCPPTGQTALS